MSLESIPLEVILCYILPYLHISDILTLCVISRSLNKDFDDKSEIRKENNRTYQNNVVVVSSSLFVREATQRILPNPP